MWKLRRAGRCAWESKAKATRMVPLIMLHDCFTNWHTAESSVTWVFFKADSQSPRIFFLVLLYFSYIFGKICISHTESWPGFFFFLRELVEILSWNLDLLHGRVEELVLGSSTGFWIYPIISKWGCLSTWLKTSHSWMIYLFRHWLSTLSQRALGSANCFGSLWCWLNSAIHSDNWVLTFLDLYY